MTWLHKTQNSSYNFKAPSISADADTKVEVVFPTKESQTLTPAATMPVTIKRQFTVIDMGTLAAAATLNATIGSDVEAGAKVLIKALSDGTARDVTFGTGFNAPNMSGTISTKKAITMVYDGTAFIPSGPAVVIT